MSNPVNKEDFWKWRIENAKELHHSVYLTSEEDWRNIEKAHKEIVEPYKDKKVLDAGCGYGRSSEWFTNYLGVDFSPDFIELAKSKYPDKEFMEADLKDLPFKDNEFYVAVCVSIKNMIVGQLGGEVWDKMEKELLRVAKEVVLLEYTNPKEHNVLRKPHN